MVARYTRQRRGLHVLSRPKDEDGPTDPWYLRQIKTFEAIALSAKCFHNDILIYLRIFLG